MLRHLFLAAAAFFSLSACGKDGAPEEPQDKTAIELSFVEATENSVTVDAELRHADVAYCTIGAADSPAPSLAELRKGQELTASGKLTFDGLEPGSAYKVFGVAALQGVYTGVGQLAVKTAGHAEENYPARIEAWCTTADRKSLFAAFEPAAKSTAAAQARAISIDLSTRYQTMEGFGPAITGSAAYNLLKMSAADRDRILRAAFDPDEGMGYNYVRISIGCSDFSLDEYTCCDREGIEFFEIHELDRRDLFPVLHEILAINPGVKIIAAPWTCPLWMKIPVSGSGSYDKWNGGRVDPDHYADYAEYFVQWILAMEEEGFAIEAITPQNEPLNEGNSASTYMSSDQQREFVKRYLGPAFEKQGIATKIWAYDHNFDVPDYVTSIFADPEAAKYFDGSAWHAYGGKYTVLEQVHKAAPDKHIYFTEQSIGTWCPDFGDNLMWHMSDVCLGTINNYCRAVVLWNFMLDAQRGPNRPGGCTTCYGFVDCDGSYSFSSLNYRSHWYAVGHLSKVVKRDACRVKSAGANCAVFENPDGSLALVLLNSGSSAQQYVVHSEKGDFVLDAPARSVISTIWK
ncbi:MAG: glucosylceramidase [Alistipes sp.]|nr:glucosylceramidase [Alistipes senegalensis]MCM1249873.1 glucosylceramidase [Alistipes sp.]